MAFDGESNHYCSNGFESIDIIEIFGLNFSLGNAIKYILHCEYKTFAKREFLS